MPLPSRADLADLPEPTILEAATFDAIYQRRLDTFLLAAASEGLDLGEFVDLQSATETILLQEASYDELLLRRRIDEVYRSNLLYFAHGATLDHVGDSHGVPRVAGDGDADYRDSVRLFERGSSSAGPDEWWAFHAKQADVLVEDIAVSRVQFPIPAPGEQRGHITIAILAETPDGTPSEATLARVRGRLTSPAVRGNNTTPHIVAATSRHFDVTGRVWLRPDAPAGTFEGLADAFRAAMTTNRALGWNVTHSWRIAQLMRSGVQSVVLDDTSDIAVAPNACARVGAITLQLAGVNF